MAFSTFSKAAKPEILRGFTEVEAFACSSCHCPRWCRIDDLDLDASVGRGIEEPPSDSTRIRVSKFEPLLYKVYQMKIIDCWRYHLPTIPVTNDRRVWAREFEDLKVARSPPTCTIDVCDGTTGVEQQYEFGTL